MEATFGSPRAPEVKSFFGVFFPLLLPVCICRGIMERELCHLLVGVSPPSSPQNC